jgi:hypothetical protein
MPRGRVGGKIGLRTLPQTYATTGVWGLFEASDALRAVNWPRSEITEYGPNGADLSCPRAGTLTVTPYITAGWGLTVAQQWQLSTDAGATWTDLAGETAATLVLSGLTTAANGYRYRVRMTAGLRTKISADAAIVVDSVTLTVTQHPTNQTASGNSATFFASVSANGVQSPMTNYFPTLQWQKSTTNSGVWTNINGATGNSVSLSGLSYATDNGDQYRMIVVGCGGNSITTNPATLTVP